MRLDQLIVYFDTSPALKLFRSPNAPFILDFLYQNFKNPGRIAMSASELLVALADYRESIQEAHPDALREKPEHYLSAWCSGKTRWLHRFLDAGRNEPLYQLTPHTEDVFVFLDRALQKDLGFIGTESRLRLIITTLADLVAGASHDPDVRLAHLREERRRIDDEIDSVVRDGVSVRYTPPAVRERFGTAVRLLKDLLADFRAVEERFKEITRQVQQRQLEGRESRGNILQFALDSEDVLKADDQGVSFYEFVRFILSPIQQEKLQAVITELGRIEELAQQEDGLVMVRRMVPALLDDAAKVMRTNQRLSATLRRLLDARAASDRRRLTQLLSEIRSLAAGLSDEPPHGTVGVTVDVGVHISSPFARTFWAPPATFDAVDLIEHITDDERRVEMFQMLARMHRLDWTLMRNHIDRITRRRKAPVSLRELIEEFPPTAGVVELLGYIQIAKDDQHVISREKVDEIVLPADPPSNSRKVTVPLIFFLPPVGVGNAEFTPISRA